MSTQAINRKLWIGSAKGAILPLATLMLVGLMIVPVPSFMLDIGFITNIMISLAVLMVALNAAKPLDFSSFPTVLLFTTLLRLALNVASTRVVLVDGHTGANAAGYVIEAFGRDERGSDHLPTGGRNGWLSASGEQPRRGRLRPATAQVALATRFQWPRRYRLVVVEPATFRRERR